MFKKFINDLKKEFCGYNKKSFTQDLMAGITVAAVALPLALAFGVSSGADAASGLVTAIIAGIMIGSLGGASYQISGPTGAMSAILLTVCAKYGISGVLTAGLLSGIILIIAAIFKTGKLVSYIPSPVITGFTSGIAIVIALGQIDNFFGTTSQGADAIEKIMSYFTIGFHPNLWAVFFGGIVILIMLIYPKKWQAVIPSSLASIIVVLILNIIINPDATLVKEVGQIPKSLMTENGLILKGIPFSQISNLIVPAFSIAALGMIESLLCGASAGKMTGERIDPQRELIAQGIGNIIIPLFGGVPATAAIARTSVAIKSGGKTRLVSIFHSITLILSMFILGGVMSRIPLCALAGVLMVTAWRMNEWDSIKLIFHNKIKTSITMFVVTMICTVIFDLTVAIVVGVVFAMLMFIIKSCNLTVIVSDIDKEKLAQNGVHTRLKYTRIVYLSGPLFFGTQDKLSDAVNEIDGCKTLILSMRGVPLIDDSAISELKELIKEQNEQDIHVLMCGIQKPVEEMMERAEFFDTLGRENVFWDAVQAIKYEDSIVDFDA